MTSSLIVQPTASVLASPPELPTHERILAAAASAFAARGYGGTSIAEIAGEAGISKAGLYNYYRSKEELLLDLLGRYLVEWDEACKEALERDVSRRHRLEAHFCDALAFAVERPVVVAVLRHASALVDNNLGQRVEAILGAHARDYQERMDQFFAGAVTSAEVEAARSGELAQFWMVFFDGVLSRVMCDPEQGAPLFRQRHELFSRAWIGLGGKDA